MARLRSAPSATIDPPILLPPTTEPRPTRSRSLRKAAQTLSESPSKRELRYTSFVENNENESFLAPRLGSPKKAQRALRPVASNSRLLRESGDESFASFASPEKEKRERLGRGNGLGLSYSRGLTRMRKGLKTPRKERENGESLIDIGKLVKVGAEKTVVEDVDEEPVEVAMERTALDDEVEEPVDEQVEQSSILCYDEEDEVQAQIQRELEGSAEPKEHEHEDMEEELESTHEFEDDKENAYEVEEKDKSEESDDYEEEEVEEKEDESEDEEPVVNRRYRRQTQPRTKQEAHSEDEDYHTEEDNEEEEDIVRVASQRQEPQVQCAEAKPAEDMLPPLQSMRPPHRKGRSTISEWALDVIDLTDSPEAPASFMLPPPATARPMSSSSQDVDAFLQFFPTPTKQRSPRKAPPLERPVTPPLAPPSPKKLVSPTKLKARIPEAPNLRPSLDAFWCPEVVNTWNETHSPKKQVVSPRKQKWLKEIQEIGDSSESDTPSISPTTSPRKKSQDSQSPTKKSSRSVSPTAAEARAQRKAFSDSKHALAQSFLAEIDNTITGGRIASMSESTGGIKLIWSKTLKTTAGRANWRREQLRLRTGPSPADLKVEYQHHCSIELAEKVIDDEERLYNVLAHEYCHLTTFMISGIRNNPHGAEFKSWAAKVSRAFTHKGVEVTTKHSYQIAYKYVWECIVCGYEFKRHSKSVDPARHSCGRCKGKLVQTKPTPRGGAKSAAGDGKPKEKSEYQLFVKAKYATIKKQMEEDGKDTKLGSVMAAVAEAYRAEKDRKVEKGVVEVEDLFEGLRIQDEDT